MIPLAEPAASATLDGARKIPLPTITPTITATVDGSESLRGSAPGVTASWESTSWESMEGSLELSRDRTDQLTPGAVSASRGSGTPRSVDLVEDVRAVQGDAPLRRIVVRDRIEERRRLTKVNHGIEGAGQRARVSIVVAAPDAGADSAQRAPLHGIVDEQRELVLRRRRQR